jgi:hypothetical protein
MMKINQDQLAYETARSIYHSTKYPSVRRIMKNAIAKLKEKGVESCCR